MKYEEMSREMLTAERDELLSAYENYKKTDARIAAHPTDGSGGRLPV